MISGPHTDVASQELERRPTAASSPVEDLLDDVARGRIRVPEFQRGLKWDDEDRRNLFDSILRGYPIGTLLFWKRAAPAERLKLGELIIDAGERSDALWVVDGQQRVTTLANALLIEPDSGSRQIFVRLESAEVRYGKNLSAPEWLPVYQAADTERLLEWVHGSDLDEKARRAAFAVGKRLREYQVPHYIVETEDEGVLRRIFDRTNSSGKALEQHEVFDALHGGGPGHRPSSLEAIAEDLATIGFGHLEPNLVLRSLLSLQGKDPSQGFRQVEGKLVPTALQDTYLALGRTLRFVQGEAGFPHITLLPYKLPLVTLSVFFHHHSDPKPRTRTLLRRWIWRGALDGSHRGDTVGLRKTLEAIEPEDEDKSVQALLQRLGTRPSGPPQLRPFNFGHARSKLQLVALASLGPRNAFTGEPLDLPALCEQDTPSHPAHELYSAATASGAERGLAGRVLHPRVGPHALRQKLTEVPLEILKSQAISEEAVGALRRGDLDEFFSVRELELLRLVEEFLARKAEWEQTDRPSLQYLIDGLDD